MLAPHLIVPGYKGKNGQSLCLQNFGPVPFFVLLPLTMLREHIESNTIRILPDTNVTCFSKPSVTAPVSLSQQNGRKKKGKDKEQEAEEDNGDDQYDYPDDLEEDDESILTKVIIQFLHDVALLSNNETKGNTPLECKHLDVPPHPKDIKNIFFVRPW